MTRLVLLHGFCGAPDAFAEIAAALGGDGATMAPALRGHGGAEAGARFEDEVDRIAALVPGAARPLLVGYSLGGRLAMGLVARHPGRWCAAIFVGAHPGLRDPGERAARRALDARWLELLRGGDLARFVEAWEAQPLFASQVALDPARRARQRAARLRHDPHALARALEVLGLGAMPCWEDALVAWTRPMVFVAGGLDARYVAIGRALAERARALRLVEVPGVGHNVVLEAPGAVTAIARRLLAEASG